MDEIFNVFTYVQSEMNYCEFKIYFYYSYMCMNITDAPKLEREIVETWMFVAVSGL